MTRVSREAFSSPASVALALRMTLWVLVLPVAKRVVSIERLTRFMWRDGALHRDRDAEGRAIRLATRLTRFSGRNCLERSLILYRYLSQGGADPVLVLGIAKPGERDGHAWVLVDRAPVVDSATTLAKYEPVVAFGRHAQRVANPERSL